VPAGAIIAGTLNMEEGALGAVTDNPWFGRTLNPWSAAGEALTPGGSSGGSGAAVAAGLCVMALGTDTMGSVRIPSAYCGVAGLKPSRGLIPTDGVIALSTTLDHVGPITRSARDLPAFVSALSGQPERVARGLTGLRIGRWRFEDHLSADAAVQAAFEAACARLDSAGAGIVDVHAKAYEFGRTRRRGLLISEIEGHEIHAEAIKTHAAGFSDHFRRLLDWGAGQPADKARAAYGAVRAVEDDAKAWFADVDLVVSPTALEPAFAFGDEIPAGQADLTAFADMAGIPAAAVPMGLTDAGRPVSIQFMASAGQDGLAMKAARQFEVMTGGPFIPPGY
jgi:aspartyl-tRNA(Asn)/glutamyl-tRNA(Gln) amidotransferase subunit A